jgi:agmatinase
MATLGRMFGAGGSTTFMGLPTWEGGPVPAVILGADGCTPYPSVGFYCAGGPEAIRAASAEFAASHHHMNFDTGHPAFATRLPADGGDIPVAEDDPEGNRRLIRDAVAEVLESGAVPVLLGGDDSLPIPMLQALEGQGPLTILQIDAHIDWRREIEGERWGLSSTMRRATRWRMWSASSRSANAAWAAPAPPTSMTRPLGRPLRPASARPIPCRRRCPRSPRRDLALCLDWDALDPCRHARRDRPAPPGASPSTRRSASSTARTAAPACAPSLHRVHARPATSTAWGPCSPPSS